MAETPFALSRGGLFFAARKMAAAPTRRPHLVRGCRGLEFSPSCSLYTMFVRSFVRSLAHAASPSPFVPLPPPLLAYATSPPLPLPPAISRPLSVPPSLFLRSSGFHQPPPAVSSIPPLRPFTPSSGTPDRHRCWREAKFSISFSPSCLSSSFFFLPQSRPSLALALLHPLSRSVSRSPGVSCSARARPPLHGVPVRSRRNIVT